MQVVRNPVWRSWRTQRADVLHALGRTAEGWRSSTRSRRLAEEWGTPGPRAGPGWSAAAAAATGAASLRDRGRPAGARPRPARPGAGARGARRTGRRRRSRRAACCAAALAPAEDCGADGPVAADAGPAAPAAGSSVPDGPRPVVPLTPTERRIASMAARRDARPRDRAGAVPHHGGPSHDRRLGDASGWASNREGLRAACHPAERARSRPPSSHRQVTPKFSAAEWSHAPDRGRASRRTRHDHRVRRSAATAGPTPTYTRATRLRGLCGGAVHLPGDPGYDAARMPWNVAVDQRPAAVAYPANADEVAEVVRAAAAAGLRVAPQGTGHNAGPLGDLDDAVLLRTSAMTGVDDRRRAPDRPGRGRRAVARRGRGGRAARPRRAARLLPRRRRRRLLARRRHRLVRPRSSGMAANSVTAVELVLADGTPVRADADTEPGRCSGRSAAAAAASASSPRWSSGSTTSTTAYAGMLVWDQEHAEKVLRAWAAWTADAPDASPRRSGC